MSAQEKCKVLFVIPTLGGGGAEKLLIQLLGFMDRGTFAPILAVLNKEGVFVDQVPEDVPVLDLAKRSRYSFPALQWRINNIVRRFGVDVAVGLISHTNFLILMSRALFGWKRPVIAGMYSTLGSALPSQSHAWLRKILVKRLYPKAEAVVTVSRGAARDLVEVASLPENKVRVIYNPVDIEAIRAAAEETVEWGESARSEVVAVGRLTPAKDYPTLLRAFQTVSRTTDAHLTIIGEGEERPTLERLSRELGLEGRATFLGFVPNQYKYMARANLLVLSSAWEGFPTVIEEAMACGTAVVATDCHSGPGEIITDGVNGLLVPVGDEVKLAGAVTRLLEDHSLRERLAQAGRRRVEEFGAQKITREYESLVLEVAGGGWRFPPRAKHAP